MIKNTFLFLPRIKRQKELSLWKQNITDWNLFLNSSPKGISKTSKYFYDRQLREASQALYSEKTDYFIDKLPSAEMWRLYDFFKNQAIFLDIEASGTSGSSYLTVLGLYDGENTKTLLKNFDVMYLRNILNNYKLLITFNGSSFDVPYLSKKYPKLLPKIPHIDLRHVCAKTGLIGGLKDIEKQLGIRRQNQVVEKMYGGDPIKLWRKYLATGDEYFLQLLIEYNEEDVVNLKTIADHSINLLKKSYYKYIKQNNFF